MDLDLKLVEVIRRDDLLNERLGGGYPSSSQWDAADFAPIRESMKTIFQRLQWYDPA
jgi:hypothetical protein